MPPPKAIAEAYKDHEVRIAEVALGRFHAVAFDKTNERVASIEASTEQEARAAIRQAILERHADFVGVDGAINLFLKAYPDGFEDELYLEWERSYKDKVVWNFADGLGEERLRDAISERRWEPAIQPIRRNLINILARQEIGAWRKYLGEPSEPAAFLLLLSDLLYGEREAKAFEAYTGFLAHHGLGNWPIVTYVPFLRFPVERVFVKPTVMRRCAERIGYDLAYETKPSWSTYQSVRGLYDRLRVGIAGSLKPKDNIDIQSLIYVTGDPDVVPGVLKHRAAHRN